MEVEVEDVGGLLVVVGGVGGVVVDEGEDAVVEVGVEAVGKYLIVILFVLKIIVIDD